MNRKERRKFMKKSIPQILKALGVSRVQLKRDLRRQGFDPSLTNQYLSLVNLLKSKEVKQDENRR